MNNAMVVIIGIIILITVASMIQKNKVKELQNRGLYPETGQGTMEQVNQLIAKGYKIQAIKLYREIKDVGLKEAKEEVEKLAKQQPNMN